MGTTDNKITDTGVELSSSRLVGRRIALAVSGGIGAVETPRIARELRRHGAWVRAYLTPGATAFITELSLSWSTGGPAVVAMGPGAEHLDDFDLILVVPTTLNTLAKAALGLADNPVTLLLASHFGKKTKTLFVPTMNAAMLRHPRFAGYREELESWGARFYQSPEEEGRHKVPAPELLVEEVIQCLTGSKPAN